MKSSDKNARGELGGIGRAQSGEGEMFFHEDSLNAQQVNMKNLDKINKEFKNLSASEQNSLERIMQFKDKVKPLLLKEQKYSTQVGSKPIEFVDIENSLQFASSIAHELQEERSSLEGSKTEKKLSEVDVNCMESQ